jgi:hypothetical protein
MKLIEVYQDRESLPMVTVRRKGTSRLNPALARLLGVKGNQHIMLFRAEDTNDYYLGMHEKGPKLTPDADGGFSFSLGDAGAEMLDSMDLPDAGYRFTVASKATEAPGTKITPFAILTKSAKPATRKGSKS